MKYVKIFRIKNKITILEQNYTLKSNILNTVLVNNSQGSLIKNKNTFLMDNICISDNWNETELIVNDNVNFILETCYSTLEAKTIFLLKFFACCWFNKHIPFVQDDMWAAGDLRILKKATATFFAMHCKFIIPQKLV